MKELKINNRKSIFVEMNDAWHDKHDFIEVTEWTNGEGWDIQLPNGNIISLHFTEYEIIKELIKTLDKYEK